MNHPTAQIGNGVEIGSGVVIDERAIIGDGCFIGHNCVIRDGVELGRGVVVGHLCVIESNTKIGNMTTIQSQCHITKNAVIGMHVYFGPSVCIINEQKISKWRRNMKQKLIGPTIGDGARIGAHCTIMPGVTIGVHAEIGAGSVLTKDVPPHEVWYGHQAECKGKVPKEETILSY